MTERDAGVMYWLIKRGDLYLDEMGGPQPPEVTWRVVRWVVDRDDATKWRDRDCALGYAVKHGGHVVAVLRRQRPTYNHTRTDGPWDPCQECLWRMPRHQLVALVNGLRQRGMT